MQHYQVQQFPIMGHNQQHTTRPQTLAKTQEVGSFNTMQDMIKVFINI